MTIVGSDIAPSSAVQVDCSGRSTAYRRDTSVYHNAGDGCSRRCQPQQMIQRCLCHRASYLSWALQIIRGKIMKMTTRLCFLLAFGSAAYASVPVDTPTLFAPQSMAGDADDGAAAFTPNGATVYFMRGTDSYTLMESDRIDGRWSAPRPAPFSGQWRDLDPAMAPDGSYMLFVSNRPVDSADSALDAVHAGKRRVGQGMNLWRVNRRGQGWGEPTRLPDSVNTCSMTFAPTIAADNSVYFIGCDAHGRLRLQHAAYLDGQYVAPIVVPMGDADWTIRDPAVAPDRSFMVVSTKRETQQPYRLAIAFHTATGWSAPTDLGDSVNSGTHSMGAQLGPDHRTLYFYSDRRLPPSHPDSAAAWNNGHDHIWQVSLAPWLDATSRLAH